jgi:sterol desaturase/sphingolipid hydroxylase (fatty acid hydroxylase superfamily)
MQEHLDLIRLPIFLGFLLALILLEAIFPRLSRQHSRRQRWSINFVFGALNMLVVRLLLPVGLVGYALWLEAQAWTVNLTAVLPLPLWAETLICLILLDLIIYGQHRLLHSVPWLWRLHKMHHSDQDLDTSSALRFHPFEAAFSLGVKLAAITALGATAQTVILFEILLSSFALFNHANWFLRGMDAKLRRLLVTPDMHRIHHRAIDHTASGNFGFCLSVWDRLFSSYQETLNEAEMSTLKLGLTSESQHVESLPALMRSPFSH